MSASISLRQLLDRIPAAGSEYGGGSVTAASLAMACALIEKVSDNTEVRKEVKRFRRVAQTAVVADAGVFKKVLTAMRRRQRPEFKKRLKEATELQLELYQIAYVLSAAAKKLRSEIKAEYRCDLKCAEELLTASKKGAQALIRANLDWLSDPAYTRKIEKEL